MKENFDESLRLLLKSEGGFVNHPVDPGGMTCLGVTKKAWEAYTGEMCNEADMRALTPKAVTPFYRAKYWDAVSGDDLPKGIDYAVFDFAVNAGPMRAIKVLQSCIKTLTDGEIGPKTLMAIAKKDPATLIEVYCEARLNFLSALPTWKTFGKGWERRVDDVARRAKIMLR
jgi:lysozyme family protein